MIAKKSSGEFHYGISDIAMMVAVAAMFIVISIFSGLEELNKELIANLHPDLTIKSMENPETNKTISLLKKKNA